MQSRPAGREHANLYPGTMRLAHAYTNPYRYSYSNSDRDLNADSSANSYGDSHLYADPDGHGNIYAYTYGDSYVYSYTATDLLTLIHDHQRRRYNCPRYHRHRQ